MKNVCENDEIIVDVHNDLGSDSTSIHWHGIHQIGTQYMDGVSLLTQCPITQQNTFRADGLFGALIVRSRHDPHKHLYDVDDAAYTMLVMDWLEVLGIAKYVSHHHDDSDAEPYNILINGMGKFRPLQKGTKSALAPLYEYRVKYGLRYRFRVISNGLEACPIEISVQGHTLLLIRW
ncbi:Laccase-1 [Armadillidium vulgare]|nr:Laccase-1 [Armadillidium vulgare]